VCETAQIMHVRGDKVVKIRVRMNQKLQSKLGCRKEYKSEGMKETHESNS